MRGEKVSFEVCLHDRKTLHYAEDVAVAVGAYVTESVDAWAGSVDAKGGVVLQEVAFGILEVGGDVFAPGRGVSDVNCCVVGGALTLVEYRWQR